MTSKETKETPTTQVPNNNNVADDNDDDDETSTTTTTTSTTSNHTTDDLSPRGHLPLEKAAHLSPEVEFGNIEYKWKLINPTQERLEHLVTQLKWRLGEGMGEAIYEVGVEDNGVPTGLKEEELQQSIATLQLMAQKLEADLTILRERDGVEGKVAEVLIRRYAREDFLEIRIAVVGNVDSGKVLILILILKKNPILPSPVFLYIQKNRRRKYWIFF
eukprot:TRINITY_DN4203_c0_g3_i2.p1 TRINITY_DN4203_c0_g3~~TRINITY_DN4203_c0_g3_i2.p1  ORF type:complete len:217 (+),score=63.47 TRINITY_DN4203_c0_g3_i2:136-786(+)